MAVFNSETFQVATSSNLISQFLSDPQNLIEILPQDRVDDWKADASSCSFKIKGLASIFLVKEKADNNAVVFRSNSDKPFPFLLIIDLDENDGFTNISARFDAEVNTFMGSMLKGPLTNFLNHLGSEIKQKYSEA